MRSELDYPLRNKYYKHLWFVLVVPVYLLCFWICEQLVVDRCPTCPWTT